MVTINQMAAGPRTKKKKKNNKKALFKCPQRKGVCVKILTRSPKKPNSARRKVAKVRLTTRKTVFVFIPGEGHNLNAFSWVLVRGGNVKDLPSVRYKAIRGKEDLNPVLTRMNARSKYGTKKIKDPKVRTRAPI